MGNHQSLLLDEKSGVFSSHFRGFRRIIRSSRISRRWFPFCAWKSAHAAAHWPGLFVRRFPLHNFNEFIVASRWRTKDGWRWNSWAKNRLKKYRSVWKRGYREMVTLTEKMTIHDTMKFGGTLGLDTPCPISPIAGSFLFLVSQIKFQNGYSLRLKTTSSTLQVQNIEDWT
jgi:hypothetical protein